MVSSFQEDVSLQHAHVDDKMNWKAVDFNVKTDASHIFDEINYGNKELVPMPDKMIDVQQGYEFLALIQLCLSEINGIMY